MSLNCAPDLIRVLLVEDNHGDGVLFKKCLKKAGRVSELEIAQDGEVALRRLMQEGEFAKTPLPQLVVMDLNLPRVSGQELLAEIKSHSELKSIPIIVLTSSEDEEDVRGCYTAGANCVLIKATDYDGVARLVSVIESFWIDTVCFAKPRKPGGQKGATL